VRQRVLVYRKRPRSLAEGQREGDLRRGYGIRPGETPPGYSTGAPALPDHYVELGGRMPAGTGGWQRKFDPLGW
jgi:hypothetical protein